MAAAVAAEAVGAGGEEGAPELPPTTETAKESVRFSFARPPKLPRPSLLDKKENGGSSSSPSVHFVKEFDGKASPPKPPPLSIPMQPDTWRPERRMKNIALAEDLSAEDRFEAETLDGGSDSAVQYGLTIRESNNGGFEKVPSSFDDARRLREDLQALPEEADLDAYESMPVEAFGEALLRGMGWEPGKPIGRNAKAPVPVREVTQRIYREGLGARLAQAKAKHAAVGSGEVERNGKDNKDDRKGALESRLSSHRDDGDASGHDRRQGNPMMTDGIRSSKSKDDRKRSSEDEWKGKNPVVGGDVERNGKDEKDDVKRASGSRLSSHRGDDDAGDDYKRDDRRQENPIMRDGVRSLKAMDDGKRSSEHEQKRNHYVGRDGERNGKDKEDSRKRGSESRLNSHRDDDADAGGHDNREDHRRGNLMMTDGIRSLKEKDDRKRGSEDERKRKFGKESVRIGERNGKDGEDDRNRGSEKLSSHRDHRQGNSMTDGIRSSRSKDDGKRGFESRSSDKDERVSSHRGTCDEVNSQSNAMSGERSRKTEEIRLSSRKERGTSHTSRDYSYDTNAYQSRPEDDRKRRKDERKGSSRESDQDERSKRPWLRSHIRVRVISESLHGGRLHLKKGQVVDVPSPTVCDIVMDGSGDLIQDVRQEQLETALPKRGGRVVVVGGKHRGLLGKLLERDSGKEIGVVQFDDDLELHSLDLNDLAEYTGDTAEMEY